MKRRRLLCVALSFSLICIAMFATLGSSYAAEKSLYPEVEEATISAKTMTYSNTAAPEYSTYSVPPAGDTGIGMIYVVPIKATNTGWMYLDVVAGAANDSYTDVYLADTYAYDRATGMISLPDGAKYVNGLYSAGEKEEDYLKLAVTSGKTYFALIKSADYSKVPAQMSIRAKIYTTGERTAVASTSKWTVVSGLNKSKEYGKATWFKVKPTKTGVMTVSLKEYGYSSSYGKIRLYNSSKKAVSETVTYSSSGKKVYFGVKKGRTYYLKVTDCYGSSSENYAYGIRYKITTRTDRALSSKSKAKKLTRKADATNTLFIASTGQSTDWYKFYVSSKRATKIKVSTSGMSSGEIYVSVYKGKKKIGKTQTIDNTYYDGGEYTVTYGSSYGKASKGTYYVKVVKSKNANGKYSIRYVK